jgi:CubicO group peptidase (beta-lactamase class C family)
MKKKLLSMIISCSFALLSFGQSSSRIADFQTRTDSFIRPFLDNRVFNGCVLVAHGDTVIFKSCYGFANIDRKIKNATQTVFKIASITKEFTALAIEIMHANGQLSKSDHISKYLDAFPQADKITIQQLLEHKSGLSEVNNISTYDSLAGRKADYSPKELYEIIRLLPFDFEPGTSEKYSNSNYALLSYIIEIVSGKSYEEFLKQNIFDPLHLENTLIDHGNLRSAKGYMPDENSNFLKKIDDWNSTIKLGSGCLSSTPDDIYTFVKSLIKGRFSKISGYSALNNGVFNLQGSSPGFTSMARYHPDSDLYVVVLSNNWAWAPWSLARGINLIYQNKPIMTLKEPVNKVGPETMQKLHGDHKAGNFSFKFYLKGDIPVISALKNDGTVDNRRTYHVVPLGADEFFIPFYWAKISFVSNAGDWAVTWTDIK